MANYNMDDIVEVKKREKRKKRLIKMLVFFSIVFIAGGLYTYREKWLPKLQGIGEKYQTIINDGKLASGNFPIDMTNADNYQMQCSDSAIYMINDAYLYIYNEDGGLTDSRQHAYSNAVLKTADGYALIYETGGTKFRLETERKTVYKSSTESDIVFGRVCDNGYVAIVTLSEKYACTLKVYDDDGVLAYERECVERIIDLSFDYDGRGAVISFIGAENGAIVTKSEKISFRSEKSDWKSDSVQTYCMATSDYDNGLLVLGDDKCAYYDNNGKMISTHSYSGEFAGCDVSEEKGAVILNDNKRRKYSIMLMKNSKSAPFVVEADDELRFVQIYDGLVYVMTKSTLNAYDFDGNLRSTASISDSYTKFRRSDKYIFLMGYDRVDRIDYES
ncbi:MAG: hypothetical protein IKI94_03830 [Ruminococcus sp.]|nr:hypothetical protein [Ruminococcus sp.]MBR6647494.1 hypothetical protein [Clostridia bacterium]